MKSKGWKRWNCGSEEQPEAVIGTAPQAASAGRKEGYEGLRRFPGSPWGSPGSRDPPAALEESPAEQGMPEGGCEPPTLEQHQKQPVLNCPGPPNPISLHLWKEEGEPWKEGGVVEGILKRFFYFSVSCSDFVSNKFN